MASNDAKVLKQACSHMNEWFVNVRSRIPVELTEHPINIWMLRKTLNKILQIFRCNSIVVCIIAHHDKILVYSAHELTLNNCIRKQFSYFTNLCVFNWYNLIDNFDWHVRVILFKTLNLFERIVRHNLLSVLIDIRMIHK